MRIACITSSWPSVESPAAGPFVREHVGVLEAAGHDVTTFTWRPGRYEDDVVVVSPFGSRSVFAGSGAPDALDTAPWRALEAPVAIAAMVRELGRHRPFDLYIGHWLVPGGLVARLAGDRAGRPSFVIGHSAGVHALAKLPRPVRERMVRFIARPGSTTVPSAALATKLGAPVDVLPMGYDPVPAVNGEGNGVLCYGRLVALKGFDLAVSAAQARGAELHIVGTGPDEARLRALAPGATFWGWADRSSKPEAFARCDRALFPSRNHAGRHEGWPVSVLEVASAGVVPFVSTWPGADEIVVDRRQLVADDGWPAVCEVDPAPFREATVEHALRYTWEALGPRWVEKVTLERP